MNYTTYCKKLHAFTAKLDTSYIFMFARVAVLVVELQVVGG